MHSFASWSVWCLVALMALYFWARIGIDFYTGYPLRYADCACALAYTLLCSWFFIIYDWNKLHLLWLALLPLLALVAPRFATEVFSPQRRKRLLAQIAAARIDVDMTSNADRVAAPEKSVAEAA
jgi:hypothetical protein